MPKQYNDVRAALSDAGWSVVREKGSDVIWARPEVKGYEHRQDAPMVPPRVANNPSAHDSSLSQKPVS